VQQHSAHQSEEQLRVRIIRAATLGISAHQSEEQPRIHTICAATLGISAHQSEEQPRICMVNVGIAAHPFNASDVT
jgi:hypothetical protein